MTTSNTFYNSPGSVAIINRNNLGFVGNPEVGQFPRRLYSTKPLAVSHCQPFQYDCPNYNRDPQIDYILWQDRDNHPSNHSRFGYPYCDNGYCIGNHPGRYNTPPGMQWQSDPPKGLAPPRFYQLPFKDPNYNTSRAYIQSREGRNII
jgi:hypothetical protein